MWYFIKSLCKIYLDNVRLDVGYAWVHELTKLTEIHKIDYVWSEAMLRVV